MILRKSGANLRARFAVSQVDIDKGNVGLCTGKLHCGLGVRRNADGLIAHRTQLLLEIERYENLVFYNQYLG